MQLTLREGEIAVLVAEGLSDKEIAASLRIAPSTVKCHLRNICEKVGARNRVQVARVAWLEMVTRRPDSRLPWYPPASFPARQLHL